MIRAFFQFQLQICKPGVEVLDKLCSEEPQEQAKEREMYVNKLRNTDVW